MLPLLGLGLLSCQFFSHVPASSSSETITSTTDTNSATPICTFIPSVSVSSSSPTTSFVPTHVQTFPSSHHDYAPPEPLEIAQGALGENRISLTFDGGAGRGHVDEILAVLTSKKVPATFFLTGNWIDLFPEAVQAIYNQGYPIGNHTLNHPHLTQLEDEEVREELRAVENRVQDLLASSTRPFFRAPYGERDERILQLAQEEGYISIYWTIDSLDWQVESTPDSVRERVLDRLQDGAIILFHLASESSYLVLDDLIEEISERGYKFVSLEDFLPQST